MLYTIAVILLIAWVLGLVGTYTIGAFVHVLLVAAIVLIVMGLLTGTVLGAGLGMLLAPTLSTDTGASPVVGYSTDAARFP